MAVGHPRAGWIGGLATNKPVADRQSVAAPSGAGSRIAIQGQAGYSMGMDRTHAIVGKMKDLRATDVVPGTPAERIGLVWPLTREAASLSRRHDVERRLQRHVARLGRREG